MFVLDPSTVQWGRSSRSSDKGNCVEVAVRGGVVAVRDSKRPSGGTLIVTPHAWTVFTAAIRGAEFG